MRMYMQVTSLFAEHSKLQSTFRALAKALSDALNGLCSSHTSLRQQFSQAIDHTLLKQVSAQFGVTEDIMRALHASAASAVQMLNTPDTLRSSR